VSPSKSPTTPPQITPDDSTEGSSSISSISSSSSRDRTIGRWGVVMRGVVAVVAATAVMPAVLLLLPLLQSAGAVAINSPHTTIAHLSVVILLQVACFQAAAL